MKTLLLADLKISPKRHRREFDPDKLRELAESIETGQLQNAIVVRETPEGLELVSGERRVRAIRDYIWALGGTFSHDSEEVPVGYLPYVTLGDLPYHKARLAELDENLRRENLTWQESALAIAEVVELMGREAQRTGKPAPTFQSIAMEYSPPARDGFEGTSMGEQVRQQVVVSRHLADPDIARERNLKDAYKALKRKEETERNLELARVIGRSFTKADHTLLRGDCLELMSDMGERFDVICTDPPYGIDADNFGDAGGRLVYQVHSYGDSPEQWRALMGTFGALSFQVAKPAAHLYLCCDIDGFLILRELLASLGWRVHRTPIVNYKLDGSRVPWPEHGPQRKWELVLYAVKGNKPVTRIYPDVIETRGDDNLGHGAQKPVSLYVDLLRRSIQAGNEVLDPFCGTGTIFVAAQQLLVKATGIELDERSYGIAAKRLEGL